MKKSLSPKNFIQKSSRIVQYLLPEEVYRIAASAGKGRRGERDSLLVRTLFETGLRISEALSITPEKIEKHGDGYAISIVGKGGKPRLVACPTPLANELKAYAYNHNLQPSEKYWKFTRTYAWMMVQNYARVAGVTKRIYPHLFRHSDAIERLRQTGNPKALQLHLGHSSMSMTMRYLSTLSQEDAVKINQEVRFEK